MRAKFFVFEGLDGSGTSTQAHRLAEYMRVSGVPCHLTSEPSSGPIGQMIRQIFSGRLNMSSGLNPHTRSDLFDEQMAYLFAADRHDHLYNPKDGVFTLLEKDISVISTRYFYSSLAYHCSSSADFKFVQMINSKFPEPDAVIYLDNNVETSMARMQTRVYKDSYENYEKLSKVSENYEGILSQINCKLLRIDASLAPDVIHQNIISSLKVE